MASNVSQNTSLSGLGVFESVLNALRTYLAFPLWYPGHFLAGIQCRSGVSKVRV